MMKNKIWENFSRILSQEISSHGFLGEDNYWRDSGWKLELISLQRSKNSIGGDERFTVSCGILVPEIHEILWSGLSPSAPACQLRVRAGTFIGDGKLDKWWTLNRVSFPAVQQEVCELVKLKMIPYLSRIESISHLSSELKLLPKNLRSQPSAMLSEAVICLMNGEGESAQQLMSEIMSDRIMSGWRDKAQIVCELLAKGNYPMKSAEK